MRTLPLVVLVAWTGCGESPPAGPPVPAEGCTAPQHRPDGPDGMGGCWPGPNTTGVPAGVALTPHTGSCSLTEEGMVLDGRIFDCSVSVRAPRVVIRNSIINGTISGTDGSSFTIEDSEVRVGTVGAAGGTGIGNANFVARRVEVTGGNRSILCERDCRVEDSYVHGQSVEEGVYFHASGIRQSQGSVLIHNSITCDAEDNSAGGACSASLTGYGDFEPVRNNRIEKNLFVATPGGACAYGGASGNDGSKPYGAESENVVFVDNVFQRGPTGKCGYWFALVDFDGSRQGNVATNNTFEDGAPVTP